MLKSGTPGYEWKQLAAHVMQQLQQLGPVRPYRPSVGGERCRRKTSTGHWIDKLCCLE